MQKKLTKNQQRTLTSVRIDSALFEEFKINSIKYKQPFQALCEKAVYLFIHDEEFRKKIINTKVD